MFHKLIKGIAPVAAIVLALGVSACDGRISINGKTGVPLAELDTKGKTPTEIVLAGPDNVVVTDGDTLKIEVTGDARAADAVRFTIDDEALGIMREKNSGDKLGKATVHVTLPRLTKVTLAGSGTIDAQSLVGDAEVTVAGSGAVKTAKVTAESLDVTIAGSGSYTAAGTAKSLDLDVAGSGNSKMAGLKVGSADVSVAGSGSASFASDGKVDANIVGSGDITVIGNATCTVSSNGSGKLRCKSGAASDSDDSDKPSDPASDA